MPEKINIQYRIKPELGEKEKDKKEPNEEILFPEELPEDRK